MLIMCFESVCVSILKYVLELLILILGITSYLICILCACIKLHAQKEVLQIEYLNSAILIKQLLQNKAYQKRISKSLNILIF
jgi:hypothetical protein